MQHECGSLDFQLALILALLRRAYAHLYSCINDSEHHVGRIHLGCCNLSSSFLVAILIQGMGSC